MIELQHGGLSFRFPEVHAGAACKLEFQRTLRIPDDNRVYALPPGFCRFPLFHADDASDRVPRRSKEHCGVQITVSPMKPDAMNRGLQHTG